MRIGEPRCERGWALVVAVLVVGCHREEKRPNVVDGGAVIDARQTAPESSAAPEIVDGAKALCASYAAAKGARKVGYWRPGDPAAHPGCTLRESGELQCPEDFDGWTPKSKVTVPEAEARALLDDAERTALAAGCAPCPRVETTPRPPAGFDPNAYPARVCRAKVCITTCGDAKARLMELRKRFASTKTPTSVMLDREE